MNDLHSALKTELVQKVNEQGIEFALVRLQHSKDSIQYTLHARPNSYSLSGMQTTDLLAHIGFSRSNCSFLISECYARVVQPDFDVHRFASAFATAFSSFTNADKHLEACGLSIDRPEGWGFFYGKSSGSRRNSSSFHPHGNGHVSPKSERMKESKDQYFNFVFTWIEGGSDKGWTTHYKPIHPPLSDEIQAALEFIGGFNSLSECPEFNFEPCSWRFLPYQSRGDSFFEGNAEYAHRCFDSHAEHFSKGIEQLLKTHSLLQPFGHSFLRIRAPSRITIPPLSPPKAPKVTKTITKASTGFEYDVALSFAGTERSLAEKLAHAIRDAGYRVFYDNFYPEQLWGKNLADFFDRVYRKDSRYCVVFVSKEYSDRVWTNHERRSAQARSLAEKGAEYILPIQIDGSELEGIPPTIGYLSLDRYSIEQISQMLLKKLGSVK